jgi:hypothetical protein
MLSILSQLDDISLFFLIPFYFIIDKCKGVLLEFIKFIFKELIKIIKKSFDLMYSIFLIILHDIFLLP